MKKFLYTVWYYIKQLFPCIYMSTYKIGEVELLSIWRQWFGQILWAEVFELANETTFINSKIPCEEFDDAEEFITFIASGITNKDGELDVSKIK